MAWVCHMFIAVPCDDDVDVDDEGGGYSADDAGDGHGADSCPDDRRCVS